MRTRGRSIYKYHEGNIDYVYRLDPWWLALVKDAEDHPGFALMKDAFVTMRQKANAMGAEFAVLLFPTKEQIYWASAQQFSAEKNLDVDHPLEVVRRFLDQEKIHYCDLTSPLRSEAQKGTQLFHRINSHWNDEGNLIGAREIEKCLRAQGLLPPPTGVAADGDTKPPSSEGHS
jgi:hypothetical protein